MAALKSLSDRELTDLLTEGNERAFSEIYERYWKKLFTIAANKTASLEEAEEIVQDIFISLWERRYTIEITTTLGAYLAVSVKYKVIKILAKRSQHDKYTNYNLTFVNEKVNSTEEWLEFEELKSRLEALVSALPEKCQLVYRRSRDEGLSQKQIAEEFNISEKTVEAHIGKALKALRAGLGQILL